MAHPPNRHPPLPRNPGEEAEEEGGEIREGGEEALRTWREHPDGWPRTWLGLV